MIKKALHFLVLAVFLSSCVSIPVELPQPRGQVLSKAQAHELFSHTVRLRIGIKSSPGLYNSGSGTIVSEQKVEAGWEYVLITAAHVVELGAHAGTMEVIADQRDNLGWITKTIFKNITLSHVRRSSSSYDISVIKFQSNEKLPVTPARVAGLWEIHQASPGSTIYAVGGSFGHAPLIHKGTVASRVKDHRAPVSSWVCASINWDGGSSGGGVYSNQWGLIGVISAEQGSGVGMFVPLTTNFVDQDGSSTFLEVLSAMLGVPEKL